MLQSKKELEKTIESEKSIPKQEPIADMVERIIRAIPNREEKEKLLIELKKS